MKRIFAIAGMVTALFLTACLIFSTHFQILEAKWSDLYFRWRGAKQPQNQIVLLTIDEKSLGQVGRWPWPRATMADLVTKLTSLQPKAVGFDITFAESAAGDETFSNALRQSPSTFLGYFFYPSKSEMEKAQLSSQEIRENEQSIFSGRLSSSSKQTSRSGRAVYGVQANVPKIAEAVQGRRQGFFNIFPDEDGVIRTTPLILFYKGTAYPSLGLQLAGAAQGFSPLPLFDPHGNLEGVGLGETRVPLDPKGELFINYRGTSRTFPHLSAADLLAGKIDREQIKDKIILIGATAIGIYDMRLTPTSSNFPGLEVQANILDNLLTGDFVISNRLLQTISFALVFFIGLFFSVTLPKLQALKSTLLFLSATAILLVSGYFCFVQWGWIVPVVKPTLNGILVFGGITIYRFFTEERERRKIKKTFQQYLSPAVIREVLDHPERLKLGGERKELTVLFSDIRDFTPAAEKLPPEKLVGLLNDYFTVMTDIVFRHEGTLDKFMGDALMVVFGAPVTQPDHAARASRAAIEMVKALGQNREEWKQKYGIADLKIGIGIHTGVMAVGNMGSAKRFNYTVVGDAVNLASRLEGLTKEHNVPIIISEAHYQKVQGKVNATPLGTVQVKGKQEKIKIFGISA